MALIESKNYAFSYSNTSEVALYDINFTIESPEIILIAGDSGSGKSTFLKSFNGLIPNLVEGEIKGERLLNHNSISKMPIYEISCEVGNVFQNPRSQFFTLNSTAEIVFPMENYGYSRNEMVKKLDELKKSFPLDKVLDKNIYNLSSGERQILALVSSITLSPKILFFDEPSANLDYGNAMRLKEMIKKLKSQGMTVIVADHRFYYLNDMIDRVFLIEDGTLKIYDSEESFKNSTYNTRGFDLFHLDLPYRQKVKKGEVVASLKNVSKFHVLNNVSVDFYEHDVVCMVGNNGVGKTMLANLLTRGLIPDSGEVCMKDMPFYIMQDADYQLFGASVYEELTIGRNKAEEGEIIKVLKALNLYRMKDKHPFDLSGGEKQRLQICMALLSKSPLIIFDEPTSGLDVKSMKMVSEEIEKISKYASVLIISHDYEFIRRVANRIVYIKEGIIDKDFELGEETIQQLNNIFIEMEGEYE